MSSNSEQQMELPFVVGPVMVDPSKVSPQAQSLDQKPRRSAPRRRKAEQLHFPFDASTDEMKCAHKGCKGEVEYGAHGIRSGEVYDEYWCDSHYRERHRRQHS